MKLNSAHRGFFHEAAHYGSDNEFLAIIMPFLEDAIQAGEPTTVALGEQTSELVRPAVGDAPNIILHDAQYLRPVSTIRAYRELFSGQLAAGASRIRVVGEVPHPGTGHPWEWWARYEAAINRAFDEFPLWALCLYDTRTAPAEVLADTTRTHPHLATNDGRYVTNMRFEDPAEFLNSRSAVGVDPLESAPPMIELVDPTPAGARRAVREVSRAGDLDDVSVADFVCAVNEAVTNAVCHGRPPVRLRLWPGPDRMIATVTDRGHGPADPFAGLLPPTPHPPTDLGLWLTHQICSHVTLGRDSEGFTIRLVAGAASPTV